MAIGELELLPGASPKQSIPDFFKKNDVFVTGGNGYMGKVLVEKLLRSCKDIGNIYLLMRDKKGVSAQERWKKQLELPLFDKLKEINGNALKKVVLVKGDVMESGLGLSPETRKILVERVSVVYHGAATIAFTVPLPKAILINVRGTREMCKLMLDMKKLKVFMHISTCYAQGHNVKVVQERIYKAIANPHEMIEIAENSDTDMFKIVTSKIMEGFPNTYLFTKQLAESIVVDMCERKVPTVIYRPSLVMPAFQDPIPGWIDNNNGPPSVVLPSGNGILRITHAIDDNILDYIPLDTSVHGMVKAAWIHQYLDKNKIAVYNSSSYGQLTITNRQFVDTLMDNFLNKETVFKSFWYPVVYLTTNKMLYWILTFICQIIPSFFLDVILLIVGRTPTLLFYQRKILAVQNIFSLFYHNRYIFINNKWKQLDQYLNDADEKEFGNLLSLVDVDLWLLSVSNVYCKVVMKDNSDMNENRKHLNRLKYAYYISLWTIYAVVAVLVFNKMFIPYMDNSINYFIEL